MKNNYLLFGILILSLFVFGCLGQPTGSTTTAGKGNAIFTITDKALEAEGVTSVKLSVSEVQIHKATTDAWINVSSTAQVFDLLVIKGTEQLLANATIDAGMYNQIRLKVDSVTVTKNGVDSTAKLPSTELKIVGNLEVKENTTASAKLDFQVDRSLHATGKGELIFAPVVKLDTKSEVNASVDAKGKVTVTGGRESTSVEVGMNEDGSVTINGGIRVDADVIIEGGKIKVSVGTGQSTVKVRLDSSANVLAGKGLNSANMTITKVEIYSDAGTWTVVSSGSNVYDLIKISTDRSSVLLSNSTLSPGHYSKIRISTAGIKAGVTTLAAIPGILETVVSVNVQMSNPVIESNIDLTVTAGKDSTVTVSIDVNTAVTLQDSKVTFDSEKAASAKAQTKEQCKSDAKAQCDASVFAQCKTSCTPQLTAECSTNATATCKAQCGCVASCDTTDKEACKVACEPTTRTACEATVAGKCTAQCNVDKLYVSCVSEADVTC